MNDTNLDPLTTPSTKIKRFNKWPQMIALMLFIIMLIAFYIMIQQRGQKQNDEANKKNDISSMSDLARNFLNGKPTSGVIGEIKIPEKVVPPLPPVFPTEKIVEKPIEKITMPSNVDNTPLKEKPKTWEELQEERIRMAKQDSYEAGINKSTAIKQSKNNRMSGQINRSNGLQPRTQANQLNAKNVKNILASIQGKPAGNMGGLGGLGSILGGSGTTGIPQVDNRAAKNNAFYNQTIDKTTYLDNTRTAPRSHLEIRTGTVIPSALITAIDTQLPSMILAQVTEDVFDTATGKYLLIPQGSRLVGEYNSDTSFGQSRVALRWTRLIYPDASAIELGNMAGTDSQGRAGLSGYTNNHYGKMFTAAILSSVLDYGLTRSQRNVSIFSNEGTMAGSVGRQVSKVTTKIIDRSLNIPPTIIIPAGERMNVMVNKDIVFPKVWNENRRHLN